MSNITEYKDIRAFHPGYYIADIIDDMGITQAEFATRLGTNTKTMSCLINGQANITNDLAKKLSVMMGNSEEVWLNLQSTYDQKLIEIQKEMDFDEQVRLAKLIDYAYFETIAGLPSTKVYKERIANLCSYFKVADLRIMLTPDFLVDYKSGGSVLVEKTAINSKAWVQTVMNFAQKIETENYDAQKLKSYLPEIRSFTVQSPDLFVPKLKRILSECGVAFVFLPDLRNSDINGIVRWVNDSRAILAIRSSNLGTDEFWYLLFHELKHVLQRKIKTSFVNYLNNEDGENNKQLEKEADNFAMDYLIPKTAFNEFAPTKNTTDDEIVAFAKSIQIHPGIVINRLNSDGIIASNRYSRLKEKYCFDFNFSIVV